MLQIYCCGEVLNTNTSTSIYLYFKRPKKIGLIIFYSYPAGQGTHVTTKVIFFHEVKNILHIRVVAWLDDPVHLATTFVT